MGGWGELLQAEGTAWSHKVSLTVRAGTPAVTDLLMS